MLKIITGLVLVVITASSCSPKIVPGSSNEPTVANTNYTTPATETGTSAVSPPNSTGGNNNVSTRPPNSNTNSFTIKK